MSFTAQITANIAGFSKGIDQAAREIDRLQMTVEQRLGNIGKSFETFGKRASIVGVGVAAAGVGAVKAAINFESAFAGVRKTVEATEEQFASLSEGIRGMAREIPASAVEIAGVAEAAGQLGIATDHILEFTRTMIDLGEATNMTSEEAATQLARFANIVQMSQGDFDKLGSTIVELGNNLATTEGEIVQMSLRLAAAGNQVGMTQAEIMSFSGALSSVGIAAEAGGTAFSRVMTQMQLAVETNSDKLKSFASVAGMSADEFSAAFRDNASGAIISFIEGLGRANEQGVSTIKVLDDMGISEIRMRDALMRAAGAGDLFRDSIEMGSAAWEENIALTEEAEQRYATTESRLRILRNTLTEVGIQFGELLLPSVQKVSDSLKGMLEWVNSLDPSIKKAIVAISGIAVAIGPVSLAIGKLLQMLPAIKIAFTAMTGPIGIAVAAIAGAVTLIIANWDSIKEYFTTGEGAGVFNTVKEMATVLKDDLKRAFENIKKVVMYVWDAMGSDIIKVIRNSVSTITAVVEVLVNTFRNVVQVLDGIFRLDFKTALDGLTNLFTDIFAGIGKITANTLSSISSSLAGFFDLIGLDKWAEGLRSFSEKMKPSVSVVTEEVEEVAETAQETTDAIKELGDEASITFASLLESADEVSSSFKDGSSIYELVRRTSDEITVLNNKLEGLRSGAIVVQNVKKEIEETENKVKELSAALNLLTGDRDLNLNLKIQSGAAALAGTTLMQDLSPVITPQVDTSLIKDAMGDISQGISIMTINISDMLTQGLTDIFGAVSDAIMTGDSVMSALGASLLGTLGGILVDLGQMTLGVGIGIEAVKKALTSLNPVAAIAAGAGLIALGSLFSAGARKLGSSMGGGYASAPSMANSSPSYGHSEYRGAYQDDFVVTFVQKGSDLMGVLDTAEQRRRRT